MIYSVILDMDGLMFDTERLFARAWDYAGEKMGIGKAGFMGLRTLGFTDEQNAAAFREEFGDAFDKDALERYTAEFFTDFYEHNPVPVKTGLRELLSYLKEKGIKTAVASSSPGWLVERNLNSAEVKHYLDFIISGDMITHSKPDPEIFLLAAKLLETEPSRCLVLEDSPFGILAGHRAGCLPIMIPDLIQPDEATRSLLFGCMEDLLQVRDYLITKENTDFFA